MKEQDSVRIVLLSDGTAKYFLNVAKTGTSIYLAAVHAHILMANGLPFEVVFTTQSGTHEAMGIVAFNTED